MADLPTDIMVDILSRLPAKSLVKFKCVFKSWYALFENPHFISKHMVHQPMLHITLLQFNGEHSISLIHKGNDGNNNTTSLEDIDMDLPLPYPSCELRLIGQCDGLLAMTDLDDVMIICNPAIKEIRHLPVSSLPQKISGPDPENSTYTASTMGVGFGYDSKTKDYKVVRFVRYYLRSYSDPEYYTPRAEVFSLHAANSSWREISYNLGARARCGHDMENYINGVYYWYAKDHDERVVISFQMGDEVFQQTLIPVGYPELEYNITIGSIDNDSIALFFFPSWGFESRSADVWVKTEVGAKESWIKQLTFMPIPPFGIPVILWKNGQELLYKDRHDDLASYDLATLRVKKISHIRTHTRRWAARPYKKTLVSVNRRDTVSP